MQIAILVLLFLFCLPLIMSIIDTLLTIVILMILLPFKAYHYFRDKKENKEYIQKQVTNDLTKVVS